MLALTGLLTACPPRAELRAPRGPDLRALGGQTWEGKSRTGPCVVHAFKGSLKAQCQGVPDLSCKAPPREDGTHVVPCELGGVPTGSRLTSTAERLEFAGLTGWLDGGLVVVRVDPFLAFERSSGRRLISGEASTALEAVFQELQVDRLTTPWPVAMRLTRAFGALSGELALDELKNGKRLEAAGDFRRLVWSALAEASLLPAPPDLASPSRDVPPGRDGVRSRQLREGSGTPADDNDVLIGHFVAWAPDGTQVDFSGLGELEVPWLRAAEPRLKGGEARRFWVPGALVQRPGEQVVYDVDINRIVEVSNLPPVPLDVASPGPDAERSVSGLFSKVLRKGSGHRPEWGDNVLFHETCWSREGKVLGSSVHRRAPNSFNLQYTLTGLGELFTLMEVGEHRRAWLPPETAASSAPLEKARVCDLELVDADPPQPQAPQLFPPPSPAAMKTTSGVRCEVLTPGQGKRRPGPDDGVALAYRGWTSDGRTFVSRASAEDTVSWAPSSRATPAWGEVLQLMVEGEKRRCWFPPEVSANPKLGVMTTPTIVELTLIRIR